MKRSLFILLVSILVDSTGCLTSDNNVGSLGNDSGPADGPPVLMTPTLPAACTTDGDCCVAMDACMGEAYLVGQADYGSMVTSITNVNNTRSPSTCLKCIPPSVQVQCKGGVCVGEEIPFSPSRSASLISSHCGYVNLSDASAGSGSTKSIWRCSSTSADAAVSVDASASPEAGSVAKDAAPDSPLPASAAPDAASVGNDAAPASPEAGSAHQCQLNADGTCVAVTPNTACTPFNARRYDESAGCLATNWTTLWCCATAAGDSCGWPAVTDCLEVRTDAGVVTYWTPSSANPSMLPRAQACDQSESAKVASGSLCSSTSIDAAVPPDAHVPVMLPLCTTDRDCCISIDDCMATATMTGNGGYGPVPGTHATPGTCLGCIPPAIQVQCQGGFCVGTRLTNIYDSSSPLLRSHCGTVALPDAGAAHAASPHAGVDGGLSYQTTWTCGSY